MSIIVGIPKEIISDEKRVAATPYTIKKLIQAGCQIHVEAGAGEASEISDQDYQNSGASIAQNSESMYKNAQVILKVQAPTEKEADMIQNNALIISHFMPHEHTDIIEKWIQKKVTSLSVENIPRISKAQKMDVLSSQSNLAGYKSVLIGANHLKKFFPLLMTAAGTISPAKVIILGVGVAGLQAIATAKRLGAIVEAADIRPVVKEQVESLGAKFIDVPNEESSEDDKGYAREASEEYLIRQKKEIIKRLSQCDVVITTAQIPGKKAPILLTADMVDVMKSGSVIVDLAASSGGNCELTQKGENIDYKGIQIIGVGNIPSLMSTQASELYSKNVMELLLYFIHENQLDIQLEDEIAASSLVTFEGKEIK